MDAWKRQEDPNAAGGSRSAAASSSSWLRSKDPRIVRVSRAFGGKDRHSKICTIRGLRDRRVRLSVPTAIQLYDLQDKLGLDQPSKAVDWLLDAAKHEIDELPPLPIPPESFGLNTLFGTQEINSNPLGWPESISDELWMKARGAINFHSKKGKEMILRADVGRRGEDTLQENGCQVQVEVEVEKKGEDEEEEEEDHSESSTSNGLPRFTMLNPTVHPSYYYHHHHHHQETSLGFRGLTSHHHSPSQGLNHEPFPQHMLGCPTGTTTQALFPLPDNQNANVVETMDADARQLYEYRINQSLGSSLSHQVSGSRIPFPFTVSPRVFQYSEGGRSNQEQDDKDNPGFSLN